MWPYGMTTFLQMCTGEISHNMFDKMHYSYCFTEISESIWETKWEVVRTAPRVCHWGKDDDPEVKDEVCREQRRNSRATPVLPVLRCEKPQLTSRA